MSWLEDFRTSVHPDTAQRRLDHFSQRLAAAEAAEEQASVSGARQTKGALLGPDHRYRDLLRAHVAFAQAQIAAADDANRAGCFVVVGPDVSEPEAEPARAGFVGRLLASLIGRAA